MNERIKELIAQCSFTVTEYSMGIDSSYEDFDKEKFAELIVLECVTMLDHNGNYLIDDVATTQIKKHFGIKE